MASLTRDKKAEMRTTTRPPESDGGKGETMTTTKKRKPLSPARLRWIEKNLDRMIGEVEKSGLVDWSRLAGDYPPIERLTLPKTFLKRLDVIIEGLTRTRTWMAAQAQKAS